MKGRRAGKFVRSLTRFRRRGFRDETGEGCAGCQSLSSGTITSKTPRRPPRCSHSGCLHNAERLVTAYAPRALVLYVGDNDIGAGKSPETVAADFVALVDRVRSHQPELPIYFITIKPSRLRWDLWPTMAEANARIARLAVADPNLSLLDISRPMLDLGRGEAPPEELFWLDGLHLTQAGYAIWAEVVRPRLLADLGAG